MPLKRDSGSLRCPDGHCFDISKYGYVNLLRSNQSSQKRHGDDRLMVRSRSDFLEKGYYMPLLDCLCEKVSAFVSDGDAVLDAGCGECWYTANIFRSLKQKGINADFAAADISKDALRIGARREKGIACAVAGVNCLPVADSYCAAVLNIFAPCAGEEFYRILREGGCLIRAVPLKRHLMGLKESVYEHAYENEPENPEISGFEISDITNVTYTLSLDNAQDIEALFKMTPYYYKTSREGQQRLAALSRLETEAEFGVITYRKCAKYVE